MRRRRRRLLVVSVLLVASLGIVGPAAAEANATMTEPNRPLLPADGSPADGTVARASLPAGDTQSEVESIRLTQEIRLTPDSPGTIDVHYALEIPDQVSDVQMAVPPNAQNVRTTRFTHVGDNVYEWPGWTSTASITFTLPVNKTTNAVGPEATDGRMQFADVGDWALIRRPPLASPGYQYSQYNPGVTIRNVTAGEGVIGQALIYLGPHETVERTAHGQRFRLVVPEAADLAEDREDIFDSVSEASDRMHVGDRDSQVLMIAAPTSVSWGQLGLQTGQRDFYVLADERVDRPDNTWVHEYVHTRQDFETTDRTQWFYEASAEYYAGLLTLEQDRTDYRTFRNYLGQGTAREFSSVRLVDPETWRHNGGNYLKGALVAGELDRQLRLATDSEGTFQDVFRRMNRHSSTVSHSDLLGFVQSAGGEDVAETARRYTETTERPETWSPEAHQEAFGQLPPLFRYRLPSPDSDGVRVSSQYREAPLDSSTLVPGEKLLLDVAVQNDGGAAGTYDLSVTVDGEPVASRTGRLDAGGATTETVEYTFAKTGRYTISTGEDSRTFRVREPAIPVVSDLSVDAETLRPGESVTVTATVENPSERPGERVLWIRSDGSNVTSEQIRLAPGSTTQVVATVSLEESGTYRFTAGDLEVSVTVSEQETETATDSQSDSPTDAEGSADGTGVGVSGPGFGPLVVLLAVLLLAGSRRLVERVEE